MEIICSFSFIFACSQLLFSKLTFMPGKMPFSTNFLRTTTRRTQVSFHQIFDQQLKEVFPKISFKMPPPNQVHFFQNVINF